jgi:YjbE family integral membrane protein
MDFASPQFWISVLQIIAIDIVLGGDNAVVIALACRRLPPDLRRKGIFWGVFGAIALRVVFILFALTLLQIPYLKMVGGLLLIWIGVKMLVPHDEGGHTIDASTRLWGAVKTILVADALMSIDNVIAIAAASKDSMTLVIFGLVVSVPIIVWGSRLVLKLMDRFPIVITLGAALLGWIAGEMLVRDIAVHDWVEANAPLLHWIAPVLGAAVVVGTGKVLAARASVATAGPAARPVDLAAPDERKG